MSPLKEHKKKAANINKIGLSLRIFGLSVFVVMAGCMGLIAHLQDRYQTAIKKQAELAAELTHISEMSFIAKLIMETVTDEALKPNEKQQEAEELLFMYEELLLTALSKAQKVELVSKDSIHDAFESAQEAVSELIALRKKKANPVLRDYLEMYSLHESRIKYIRNEFQEVRRQEFEIEKAEISWAIKIASFIFLLSVLMIVAYVYFIVRATKEFARISQEQLDYANAKERSQSSAKMAALGEMSAGLAHEINNPLAIISGYSNRIRIKATKDALDPAQVLQMCGKIEDTVQRVAKIIKGLRAFARDSSENEMSSTDAKEIVAETMVFCEERFKNKKVKLILPDEIPPFSLFCLKVEISQVLLNLLSNALYAADQTEGRWVRLEVQATEDVVEFIVTDSGKGIPEDIQAKIMQPFFTTKEVGAGTGLGLSISKGIMDKHSGEILIDNEKENTTFVMRVPVKPVTEKKAA